MSDTVKIYITKSWRIWGIREREAKLVYDSAMLSVFGDACRGLMAVQDGSGSNVYYAKCSYSLTKKDAFKRIKGQANRMLTARKKKMIALQEEINKLEEEVEKWRKWGDDDD